MTDEPITKVIFRKWPDGDILALFPEILTDIYGYYCQSYAHIGQYGAADYSHCIRKTRPATPREYAALKAELEGLGYRLSIMNRETLVMRETWRALIKT